MLHSELRARRLALGLTQRQLAAAIEVAPNTVARWERGELAIDRPRTLAFMLRAMAADRAADPAGWPDRAEGWLQRQTD